MTATHEIQEVVCEVLALESCKPDQNILDLGIDELEEIELIMAIEDECAIRIPDVDICNLKTINDIVAYVNKAA